MGIHGRIAQRGAGFGIWWASDPNRVLATLGIFWLNTLGGNPLFDIIGGYSRAMTWGATKLVVRGAWAGLAFTVRTTFSRLLAPLAVWSSPVIVPIGVGAGVLVTAGVIAGVHTAALQKAGLVGPDAQRASDPNWFGGLEMNPSMFTIGTVV